ncbi:MAG: hypothetical protein HOE90_03440 [Bacteriovoracaceae bacterium]|jgi:hypothetical protein|nr:hypothetical protein [Bacteriovoracaceae bacterium]
MKTTILTILFTVLTFNASAESKIIAQYNFAIHEKSDDNIRPHFSLYNASLTNDGKFQVAKAITLDSDKELILAEKDLSDSVFQLLLMDAKVLSNAKVLETYAGIVCMMMPGPGAFYDNLLVARNYGFDTGFAGALELIDGPSGCWLAHQTHPQFDHNRTGAAILKRSFRLLTLELLSEL